MERTKLAEAAIQQLISETMQLHSTAYLTLGYIFSFIPVSIVHINAVALEKWSISEPSSLNGNG